MDLDQSKPSIDVKTPLLYKNVCHTLLFLLFSKSKNTSKIMSELKPWMHNCLKSLFPLLKQTSFKTCDDGHGYDSGCVTFNFSEFSPFLAFYIFVLVIHLLQKLIWILIYP